MFNKSSNNQGRRNFLKKTASLSALAGTPFAANLLAMGAASAQTNDYKALVCIFLNGGNNQSNTLVPMSGGAYTAYMNARPTLALNPSQMLSLNPTGYQGTPLGLNSSMGAVKSLFNQGQVAILANVGTLAVPTTKAQWNNGSPTVAVPASLFSHSDQQGAWQTGLPDRASATGWLGRIGDLTASAYNPGSGVSIAISAGGNNIMQAGSSTIQYQITTQGAVKVWSLYANPGDVWGPVASGTRKIMTEPRTNMLENSLNKVSNRAVNTEVLVSNALANSSMTSPFPNSGIGQQLKIVARMIAARSALSQKRQIFFVMMGGYDFHDDLINQQNSRLKDLSDSMNAFYQATSVLGVAGNVTTFTASDFGRALQSNGRGADHGWGGHHLIMGGAVQGNKIYGNFPTVALNGPEDAGQGRLIPTTSVDEYGATLAKWFGVSDANMSTVLPNIGRFNNRNLGFLV